MAFLQHTSNRLLTLALIGGIITSLIVFAGVFSSSGTAAPTGRINIVATTGMVADLVENIAGDRATVTSIIHSGVDPHVYTPTRDDLAKFATADMIFYTGLMLEGRMGDVLERLSSKKIVYALATVLPGEMILIEDNGTTADPHIWMDVKLWITAAEGVYTIMARHEPESAAYFREQTDRYIAELKVLDAWAETSFASIPEERRVIITAHDAFAYMGRSYKLQVEGVQGISTEAEAGLGRLNSLVSMIVDRKIPTVFVESSVSDRSVRALMEGASSRGWKVSLGGSLFSDAMGEPGTKEGNYLGMIEHNVRTIVTALGGEVSPLTIAGTPDKESRGN